MQELVHVIRCPSCHTRRILRDKDKQELELITCFRCRRLFKLSDTIIETSYSEGKGIKWKEKLNEYP